MMCHVSCGSGLLGFPAFSFVHLRFCPLTQSIFAHGKKIGLASRQAY